MSYEHNEQICLEDYEFSSEQPRSSRARIRYCLYKQMRITLSYAFPFYSESEKHRMRMIVKVKIKRFIHVGSLRKEFLLSLINDWIRIRETNCNFFFVKFWIFYFLLKKMQITLLSFGICEMIFQEQVLLGF